MHCKSVFVFFLNSSTANQKVNSSRFTRLATFVSLIFNSEML